MSTLLTRPPRTPTPSPCADRGQAGDLEALVAALADVDLDVPWSPHPQSVELALLDAVFAIRTAYGSATTGVRGWVAAYAQAVGDGCDDLARLAALPSLLPGLAESGRITRQRVLTGALKIEAAAAAAATLHGLPTSPRSADDLRALLAEAYVEVRDSFCSVQGLGVETFEYLALLLEAPGHRATAASLVFARGVLARELDVEEGVVLLGQAARRLGLGHARLVHAIWRHSKRP